MELIPQDNQMSHIFSSDQPKTKPGEDELDRVRFAQEIARTLVSWQNKETLIVSLTGEWGSGKTTICNFIKDYLQSTDKKVLIVDFNPWEWSGQQKVFEGFFQQIGSLFEKTGADNLRVLWKRLEVTLKAAGEASQEIPKWIPALVWVFSVLGIGIGFYFKIEIFLVGLCSSLALASSFSSIPEKMGIQLAKKIEESVDDLRLSIAKELENLDRHIFIFIDDIDRLTKTEIALLFQLVKANASLPNLIFFLLYQKGIVTGALKELTHEDGDKYLQKIVQVEFETPNPSNTYLKNALLSGIDNVLKRENIKIEWDDTRWKRIFLKGIWPFFENLRDIKRFLGTLQFYFRLQAKGDILEVNPIDLTAIEVLRSFDYEAYTYLSNIKWNEEFSLVINQGDKVFKEMQSRFNIIVDRDGLREAKRDALHVLFENLFPHLFNGSRDDDLFLKDLRICHYEHFYKYFKGSVDNNSLYAHRWSDFLKSVNEPIKLRSFVEVAIRENFFKSFLLYLQSRIDEIDTNSVSSIFTILFDVGDQFPPQTLSTNVETMVLHSLYQRLEYENEETRTQVTKKVLIESTGFSLPLSFIHGEDNFNRVKYPHQKCLLPSTEVRWLENHGLELIRRRANQGDLLKIGHSTCPLYYWDRWSSGEAKVWVLKFAVTGENGMTLLRRLTYRSITDSRTPDLKLSGTNVERYIELNDLKSVIDQIPEGKLSHEEISYKKLLIIAIDFKKAGKSYDEVVLPK